MERKGILSTAALVTAVTFAAASAAVAQQGTVPAPATGEAPTAADQAYIWETAQQRGFQEWTRGVQAAGLQQRLGQRPHTVFLADDAAYQQVPATQRQAWQTDPAAHRAALGHSIVEGRMTMQDLRQRDHVTTIDGQRVPVRVEGDRVWVGDAEIREGDIAAGTGTIHRVDRVTWPQQHQHQQPGQMQQQPGQQQPAQPQMQQPPAQQQPTQQQPVQQQPVQQQPAQQVQPAQPQMQQPVRERVRKGGY